MGRGGAYHGEFNFAANSFALKKNQFAEKPICVYISHIRSIGSIGDIRYCLHPL